MRLFPVWHESIKHVFADDIHRCEVQQVVPFDIVRDEDRRGLLKFYTNFLKPGVINNFSKLYFGENLGIHNVRELLRNKLRILGVLLEVGPISKEIGYANFEVESRYFGAFENHSAFNFPKVFVPESGIFDNNVYKLYGHQIRYPFIETPPMVSISNIKMHLRYDHESDRLIIYNTGGPHYSVIGVQLIIDTDE